MTSRRARIARRLRLWSPVMGLYAGATAGAIACGGNGDKNQHDIVGGDDGGGSIFDATYESPTQDSAQDSAQDSWQDTQAVDASSEDAAPLTYDWYIDWKPPPERDGAGSEDFAPEKPPPWDGYIPD